MHEERKISALFLFDKYKIVHFDKKIRNNFIFTPSLSLFSCTVGNLVRRDLPNIPLQFISVYVVQQALSSVL